MTSSENSAALVLGPQRPGSRIYQKLQSKNREIRLIKILPADGQPENIECMLEIGSLSSDLKYRALSYTWGDRGDTVTITVNGEPFEATVNLVAALRKFRGAGFLGYLWADAICIDQTSIEEKSQQLSMMPDIYRLARTTLVWLGEASAESDLAFEIMMSWLQFFSEDLGPELTRLRLSSAPEDKLTNGPDYNGMRDLGIINSAFAATLTPDKVAILFDRDHFMAWRNLFRRPYWERVWVMQEVALSREIVFHCGDQHLAYEGFGAVMRVSERAWRHFFLEVDAVKESHLDALTVIEASGAELLRQLHARYSEAMDKVEPLSLCKLLSQSAGRHTSEPLDRVYSVLGLAQPEKWPFPIDYGIAPEELFIGVTAHILTTDVDILCMAGAERVDKGLPSWVADFGGDAFTNQRLYYDWSQSPLKAGPAIIERRKLALTIIPYAVVEEFRPCEPPDEYLATIQAWLNLATSKGATYPTGIPSLRAFLSTVVGINFTRMDSGVAWFRTESQVAAYYRLAAGFLWLLGALELGLNESSLEDILSPDEIGQLKAMNASNRIQGFAIWLRKSALGLREFTREAVLAAFCGEPDAPSTIPWPADDAVFYDGRPPQHTMDLVVRRINKGTVKPCFFVTPEGYMGIGPEGLSPGDLICAIPGCGQLFVLQRTEVNLGGLDVRSGEEFVLHGTSYVYGMMQGEMLDDPGIQGKIRRVVLV